MATGERQYNHRLPGLEPGSIAPRTQQSEPLALRLPPDGPRLKAGETVGYNQSRSNSLMLVFDRVCASTRLTITAQ